MRLTVIVSPIPILADSARNADLKLTGPTVGANCHQIDDKYAIYNGDSCEVTKNIPDNSIHYTLFSPPFASLYTYSNSDRDMERKLVSFKVEKS